MLTAEQTSFPLHAFFVMSSQPIEHEGVVSRWPSYQPMVLVCFAFALGVWSDRLVGLNWIVSSSGAAACLVGWIAIIKSGDTERFSSIGSTLLLIGLVFIGSFWHHGRWNWFGESEIGRFASNVAQPCCVEAIAISEPRWMAVQTEESSYKNEKVRTKLTVRVTAIRDGVEWKRASGVSDLVIHLPTRHVRSGDKIRIFGKLVASTPPTNPGQFDFRDFYRAKSKLAFLHAYHADSVKVIEPAGWGSVKLLSRLRQRLNEMTWRHVDESEAGFASAILLGNREQLSKSRRDSFMETGTVHLLAISGLHVGILAGSFFFFFRIGLLSRQKCLWATILFVIFYAWLVEFRPPVSRAAILIILFCIGRLCGENSFSFNLLAIAGLFVLIINPSDLFGIGPQLSFLAVATLTFGREWIFWAPSKDPIKRLIAGTRPFHVRFFNWMGRQLRTAILVSGLIWLIAMPLVAYRFHLLAPVALVVNPLLLVPIAWALYGGLGVLVLGWFSPTGADVCGWFCHLNLSMIEWMISVGQALPMSHVWTPGPTSWAVGLFYSGVFLFAIYPPSRLSGRWLATLMACWFVFCWMVPDQYAKWTEQSRSENPLCCTVIDVGHGASALVQFPDGRNLLYDAGSLGSAGYGARNIAGVLWFERIEHLDAVVLSHADVDHFNSLIQLTDQFSIAVVYVSPQMLESHSEAITSLFDELEARGIPVEPVSAGDQLVVGSSCEVTSLGPPECGTGDNDNSNSVVLMLEHLGKRILLPGDLERSGLSLLMYREPIDFDFVVAAHHGSRNSQPKEFMKWATPEYVAISGGSQRVTDSAEALFDGPGRKIARTDRDGAIRFEVGKDGVSWSRWKHEPWD